MTLVADKNDLFSSQDSASTFADNHPFDFHSQKSAFNRSASVLDDPFISYSSSQVSRRNLFIFNMSESPTSSDNVQPRTPAVPSSRKRILQDSLSSDSRRRSKKVKLSKVVSNRNETDDDENRDNEQEEKEKEETKERRRENAEDTNPK